MKNAVKKIIRLLPDKLYLYIKFLFKVGYWPHFSKWRSFNEYINHLKLHDRSQMRIVFADRLSVREYVKIKAPEVQLIPILWIGAKLEEADFNNLPERFIMKASHGSGMVKIVNKKEDSLLDIAKEARAWMGLDFSVAGREWFYKNLPKVVICEKLIGNGSPPPDYKFFVIHGRVEMVQVDIARFEGHRRGFYTREFQKLPVILSYPDCGNIAKPVAFDKAVIIAEKLSIGFNFLRVDLYLIDDNIYFGEITNTPGAGFEKFTPKSMDFELGAKIKGASIES